MSPGSGRRGSVGSADAEPLVVSRDQVLAFRWQAHQLDREPASAAGLQDVGLLDYGVQDTGTDGFVWSLASRGLDRVTAEDIVLLWTLRGAPHAYRRADIAEVLTATAPFSEDDAAKRVFDAAKPLREAGIPVIDALRRIGETERELVGKAGLVKGEVSTALTPRLDPPYVRDCRPCQAVHAWENPFRLAAAQGGLELDPDTSPPVMRRIPRLTPPLFAKTGREAAERFDVVRNYLRFFGPALPRDAAGYLDSAQSEVRQEWPADVVPVVITSAAGKPRTLPTVLADDLSVLQGLGADPVRPGTVRLLGAFDPYLQGRDRDLLVPEKAAAKELWPVLGRPGAVAVDGHIVGTWRATAAKRSGDKGAPGSGSGGGKEAARGITLTWKLWQKGVTWLTDSALASAVEGQAERLAASRGKALASVSREA